MSSKSQVGLNWQPESYKLLVESLVELHGGYPNEHLHDDDVAALIQKVYPMSGNSRRSYEESIRHFLRDNEKVLRMDCNR